MVGSTSGKGAGDPMGLRMFGAPASPHKGIPMSNLGKFPPLSSELSTSSLHFASSSGITKPDLGSPQTSRTSPFPHKLTAPRRGSAPHDSSQRKYLSPRFHDHLKHFKSDETGNQENKWRSIDLLEEDLAHLSDDFQEGHMLAFGEETNAILNRLDETRKLQQKLTVSHAKIAERMEYDLLEKAEPFSRGMEGRASDVTDNGHFFEKNTNEINGLLNNLHMVHESLASLGDDA